jgi:ABC-type dipeptide/oligopeptide/nickel transport system ATPase component
MISLIVGEKGSGKTKAILDGANDAAQTSKGNVAFLDKDNSHMTMLTYKVRLIDVSEYNVKSDNDFINFIKGILATDNDLTDVFVDGILKITGRTLEELDDFFTVLDELSKRHETNFILTISCARENLPKHLNRFM